MTNRLSFIRTARRSNVEGSIKLTQRRMWFAEEGGQQGTGEASGQGGSSTNGKTPIESLPADIQDYIKSLRNEAADARKKAKEELENIRAAQNQELTKKGEFERLYNDTATEVARLKPYEERATLYEKIIRDSNEERIKNIPDSNKKLVEPLLKVLTPDALQTYLNLNPELFVKPDAPRYDAGAGGSGGSSSAAPKLTQEELDLAKRMGMKPEDYLKAKAALPKKD